MQNFAAHKVQISKNHFPTVAVAEICIEIIGISIETDDSSCLLNPFQTRFVLCRVY